MTLRIKSQIIVLFTLFTLLFSTYANCANKYITLNLRYDYADHKYFAEEVFVSVNNNRLTKLTMPPIIYNDYTLVPAREVFEAMGADVDWKKDIEQVYITYKDKVVVIPINSSIGYVNGKRTDMQIPAKIINNKTMIPLRFVTTSVGAKIEWDSKTRVANISTIELTTTTTTTKSTTTTTTTTTEATTVKVTEPTPTTEAKTESTTISIDISKNTEDYGFDNENGCFYIKDTNNRINVNSFTHIDDYSNLKYTLVLNGNFGNLFDNASFLSTTEGISSVNVISEANKTSFIFNETKIMAMNIIRNGNYIYIKPVLPKEKYDKIVVIDAGHGGEMPGALGNGLVEKNLTLQMTVAAKSLFDNSDIKCYVTRTTDVDVSFDDRTNLANEVGDIFISVHINSATTSSANGTETFSLYANDPGNGLTSYILAEEMLNQLLEKLGTTNRKVKSDNFIVLRQSKIPATLIEIGFISNAADAAMMGSQEGINKVGQAIYEGVVNIFKQYPSIR